MTTTAALKRKTKSKIDLASPVSQIVELENILLLETVARRKPLRGKLPSEISVSMKVQTDVDKKTRVIQVRPHFFLVARFDDASRDELLRIEATFMLQYRVPSFAGIRKGNIDAFGEVNGMYNAWPFWREFVQTTTVRMGLPPLTMPVYRPLATEVSAKKASRTRTPRPKRTRKTRVNSKPK